MTAVIETTNVRTGETPRIVIMTKLKLLTFAALLLACVAGLLFWQQQNIRQLRADNARLLANAAETDSLREEVLRLRQTQPDATELERLRQAQLELLRLRGEASQLRRQLREAQQARRTPPATVPSPASASTEKTAPPVETFSVTVHASLTSKQTLVTGGWIVPGGKRAVVLIEPTIGTGTDLAGQIAIQARFVELSEEALAKVGLGGLKSDGKESSSQTVLGPEQTALLIASLENTQGVSVLSAPKISTLDGRQAQIKCVNVRTVAGEATELGPVVDVVPRLSPDGASVDLSVVAQLRLIDKDLADPAR